MYVFLCMYYAYTEVRARYKVHSATSREKVSFLSFDCSRENRNEVSIKKCSIFQLTIYKFYFFDKDVHFRSN